MGAHLLLIISYKLLIIRTIKNSCNRSSGLSQMYIARNPIELKNEVLVGKFSWIKMTCDLVQNWLVKINPKDCQLVQRLHTTKTRNTQKCFCMQKKQRWCTLSLSKIACWYKGYIQQKWETKKGFRPQQKLRWCTLYLSTVLKGWWQRFSSFLLLLILVPILSSIFKQHPQHHHH